MRLCFRVTMKTDLSGDGQPMANIQHIQHISPYTQDPPRCTAPILYGWKTCAPLKVKMFLWLAFLHRHWTADRWTNQTWPPIPYKLPTKWSGRRDNGAHPHPLLLLAADLVANSTAARFQLHHSRNWYAPGMVDAAPRPAVTPQT